MSTDPAQRILNLDQLASHGNLKGRRDMLTILEAGLRAADPYNGVRGCIRRQDNHLLCGRPEYMLSGDPQASLGEEVIDLDQVERIYVVGAGKGIQRAAKALEDVLGERLTGGAVIDKHGTPLELERISVIYGAHPVPDQGCVEGCQRIYDLTHDLTERDLVITLVGNGVSSLLTWPAEGVSLEDVRETTRIMQIEQGAPTQDLNPIRNHLDRMKGGRISRLLQPARVVHLLVGGAKSYTGAVLRNFWLHSMPDCTSYAQAVEKLKQWEAWELVPESVRQHLMAADPAQDVVRVDEFEQWRSRIFEVMPADWGMEAAAKAKAQELGYNTHVLYRWSHFEAAPTALMAGSIAWISEQAGEPFEPPCVLIGTHELLVTVGNAKGMGGRNQEWALSAATRIADSPSIVMAAVDSDGTDGPGHQMGAGADDIPVLAGGIVDGQTMAQADRLGLNISAALRSHDTTPALWALGDGIQVTPNMSVNDLNLVLIGERSQGRGGMHIR